MVKNKPETEVFVFEVDEDQRKPGSLFMSGHFRLCLTTGPFVGCLAAAFDASPKGAAVVGCGESNSGFYIVMTSKRFSALKRADPFGKAVIDLRRKTAKYLSGHNRKK